jgi:curved DNA-binding protein CbpA
MPTLKEEDFQKIGDLLAIARNIKKYSDCNDLYELFGIENKKSYSDAEIKNNEEKIDTFRKDTQGKSGKYEKLKQTIGGRVELCKRALNEGRDEYNEYLKQGIIEKLENSFLICVKRDKELDSKEKNNLIDELRDVGLSDQEINVLIQNWLIKYGAKEVETEAAFSTSTSSGERSGSYFFNKTYYEILGILEDADASQIKEAYDREHKEYIKASGKKKAEASARFTMVKEAYDCLKNPTKRREYDQKQNEPKGPVPTGEPKLVVLRKNDADYQFQDVRRGIILSEKITIKNTQGGLLQGTIKSDAPWLEVDRNKLLEMHEQELLIRILTSKIPRKTFQVEGNVTIETNGVGANGGKEVIPFKVILEDFYRECDRFRNIYAPLSAAIGGLLFSFGYGPDFAPLGIGASLLYAPILTKQEGGSLGSMVKATIVAGIGSFIIFAILEWVGKYFPHFIGFVIGAYLIGGLAYVCADLIMKHILDAGMNLSRFPPILVYGLSASLVILAIAVHSGDSTSVKRIAEKEMPTRQAQSQRQRIVSPPTTTKSIPAPRVRIKRSVIAEKIDNNKPVGVNTKFPVNASYGNTRRTFVVYYAEYEGASPNKTEFKVKFIKEGKVVGNSQYRCSKSAKQYSGNYWCRTGPYYLSIGDYEACLYADGKMIDRKNFSIVHRTGQQKSVRTSISEKTPSVSSTIRNKTENKSQQLQKKGANRELLIPRSRDSF